MRHRHSFYRPNLTMSEPVIVTPGDQQRLRARVNACIAEEKLTQKQIAVEIGVGYSTFAAWLANTYTGDTSAQASAVARWLDHRAKRREVRSLLPEDPGFRETPSARRYLRMFQYCQAAPDIGVIAGGAGIGKTEAAREYRRTSPNVFIATVQPVRNTAPKFVDSVAEVLGVSGRGATRQTSGIIDRLSGSGSLLIIDEAQHLATSALDQARSFHDLARCGLVLIGNHSVYSRMGDGRAEFAQIFSRIGMKITQAKPKAEDVETVLAAWNLPFDSGLAKKIAQKQGALRGMTKALRIAHMLAAGASEEVSEAHLRAAWEQIGFDARVDA